MIVIGSLATMSSLSVVLASIVERFFQIERAQEHELDLRGLITRIVIYIHGKQIL